MDIVERLRSYRPPYGWPEEYSIIVEPTLNNVAADEIERLREALADVADGINQWIPEQSMIKNTLLARIAKALKEVR